MISAEMGLAQLGLALGWAGSGLVLALLIMFEVYKMCAIEINCFSMAPQQLPLTVSHFVGFEVGLELRVYFLTDSIHF